MIKKLKKNNFVDQKTQKKIPEETIKLLHRAGLTIQYFFEDDDVQKVEIERKIEEVSVWGIPTKVIHVNNPHVKKENRRHLEDLDE